MAPSMGSKVPSRASRILSVENPTRVSLTGNAVMGSTELRRFGKLAIAMSGRTTDCPPAFTGP